LEQRKIGSDDKDV